MPNDYTDSWFSTRESTDMFGFQKAAPEKIVLQAKKMNVSGSWNLSLIEEKIREKIHERVGGTGVYEVCTALFANHCDFSYFLSIALRDGCRLHLHRAVHSTLPLLLTRWRYGVSDK